MHITIKKIAATAAIIGLLPTSVAFAWDDDFEHTQTFEATGGYQTFVVPDNVVSLDVQLWGAGGGGGSGSLAGGKGGYTKATLNVDPGETLRIIVGTAGDAHGTGRTDGGFGGGGDGYLCGGGGGRSAVRRGDWHEALTAGGGGGGGCGLFGSTGGFGGGLLGGSSAGSGGFPGAGGGSQTAGGSSGGTGTRGMRSVGGDAALATSWSTDPIHEFISHDGWNTHAYTTSEAEKNSLIADYNSGRQLWHYHGIVAWVIPAGHAPSGTVKLRRFYKPSKNSHYYTTLDSEAAWALSTGYHEEGPQGYIYPPSGSHPNDTVPLYRTPTGWEDFILSLQSSGGCRTNMAPSLYSDTGCGGNSVLVGYVYASEQTFSDGGGGGGGGGWYGGGGGYRGFGGGGGSGHCDNSCTSDCQLKKNAGASSNSDGKIVIRWNVDP